MLQPIAPSFALAGLLVSLTATAQATPPGRAAPRSIVLTGHAGEAPLLSLAPGTVTVLLFDAPLVRESVEVEGRDRFAAVVVGDLTLTLSPAVALGPTERLALRITYREGFPASAVFLLTGKPGEVDEVVSVSRPQQPGEACRLELAATHERCEALRQELEALKARPPLRSPAAVALAGVVDDQGLLWRRLQVVALKPHDGLLTEMSEGLGATTWSVVVLQVRNTDGAPWTPAWAEVIPVAGGAPRRARAVLSEQAILPPGASMKVAVEVEMPWRMPNTWLSAPHALRVCNGDGSQCLSVPQVSL